MKPTSPFLDLDVPGPLVSVRLDGTELLLPDGMNLAAALLVAGVGVFRHTTVSNAPRAAFCMMGACFECLVEIEGVTRQACMQPVRAGLVISRPSGKSGHARV